jgi:hypothetical protein
MKFNPTAGVLFRRVSETGIYASKQAPMVCRVVAADHEFRRMIAYSYGLPGAVSKQKPL